MNDSQTLAKQKRMAGLQRSAVSFRRQGSSGLVWDDKLLSGELGQQPAQPTNQREDHHLLHSGTTDNSDKQPRQEILQAQPHGKQQEAKEEVAASRVSPRTVVGSIERSRSNGGGPRYRTGRVSPAIEPPSPKVSAFGFCTCSAFGKPPHEKISRRPPKHASIV